MATKIKFPASAPVFRMKENWCDWAPPTLKKGALIVCIGFVEKGDPFDYVGIGELAFLGLGDAPERFSDEEPWVPYPHMYTPLTPSAREMVNIMKKRRSTEEP